MREKILSIKDFEYQTFRSGGPGGQNQNKRNTGVRIVHRNSGAKAESREARTQGQNKKLAFNKLVKDKQFLAWVYRQVSNIDAEIEQMLEPENLKVEIIKDGNWTEIT